MEVCLGSLPSVFVDRFEGACRGGARWELFDCLLVFRTKINHDLDFKIIRKCLFKFGEQSLHQFKMKYQNICNPYFYFLSCIFVFLNHYLEFDRGIQQLICAWLYFLTLRYKKVWLVNLKGASKFEVKWKEKRTHCTPDLIGETQSPLGQIQKVTLLTYNLWCHSLYS